MIYINGHDLTIEQVIAVSRQGETVAIAPEAAEKIQPPGLYVNGSWRTRPWYTA